MLIAATLIGVVGLADDLLNIHFGTKAAVQTLLAAGLIFFYLPPLFMGAPGLLKPVVLVVGIFWIVALSNAFNFMDGIDGLIGGVALVSVLFLAPSVRWCAASAARGGHRRVPDLEHKPCFYISRRFGQLLSWVLSGGDGPLRAPTWDIWRRLEPADLLRLYPGLHARLSSIRLTRFSDGCGPARTSSPPIGEHVYQRITPSTRMHRRTSNLYYGLGVVAGCGALLVSDGGVSLLLGLALVLVCCGGILALPKIFETGE